MPLDFPSSPTLNQEFAPVGVGKTWKWDGRAWALKKSLTGIIERDYVLAELSVSASAAANTATFNAATAEAASRGKFLMLRGSRGASRSIYPMNSVVIPLGVDIVTEGKVELRQGTSSGSFLKALWPIKMTGDLLLNGQNTSETIANGYVARHIGLQIGVEYEVGDPTYGVTTHTGAFVQGLKCHNFGDMGIELNYCNDAIVSQCEVFRIGRIGVCFWSPLRCHLLDCKSERVFPGEPPGVGAQAYERNAYGFGFSAWGGHRVPSHCRALRNLVNRVPSWEGADCHYGSDMEFAYNTIIGCAQGIAFENRFPVAMVRNSIHHNRIISTSSGTETWDSVAFPVGSGIIVNSSGDALTAQDINVHDNVIVNAGEQRPGLQGHAAIGIQLVRSLMISRNQISNAKQIAISLNGGTTGNQILYANVSDNIVDGVSSHGSIQRGIVAGPYALGRARGNILNAAAATNAEYFYQPTSTLLMDFGTVSDGSTAGGDNYRY